MPQESNQGSLKVSWDVWVADATLIPLFTQGLKCLRANPLSPALLFSILHTSLVYKGDNVTCGSSRMSLHGHPGREHFVQDED